MRLIFIPVADRPECARALQVAFDLGQKLGASVCGCHIRPHQRSEVSLQSALAAFGSNDDNWENAWTGKKTLKSAHTARDLFARMAADQSYELIKNPRVRPGAVWQEKSGSPDKLLSITGPVSDLIIVSRPAQAGGKIANLFMMGALLHSARPVLMLPQAGVPEIGKHISIAWNQSSEAAQAVAASMPLLQQAERVTIITSGSEHSLGPKAGQLATYLRFWGIKAERVRSGKGDDAKALLKTYKDSQSDLLVMGAYSRSRLRQRVFGGVTEFMLSKADIPVLMLHS